MSSNTLHERTVETVQRAQAATAALRTIDPKTVDPRPPFEGQERILELEQQVAAWEKKWAAAWDRLHQEAEQRDWCYIWDEIAAELGAPSRTRQYDVAVTVTLRSRVPVDVAEGWTSSDFRVVRGSRLQQALGLNHRPVVQEVRAYREGLVSVRHETYLSFQRKVAANSCACAEVSSAQIEKALEERGVQFTKIIKFTKGCDSDECGSDDDDDG